MTHDSDKYRLLIENLPDAFAYHQVVTDDNGKPVDYTFLEVNAAFENMIGLKQDKIIGKSVTEVLPGIEKNKFDWIGILGQVALNGEVAHFISFIEPLGRWYDVNAYSYEPGFFAVIIRDISMNKEGDAATQDGNAPFQAKNSTLIPQKNDSSLDLVDVIDIKAVQKLMDNFFRLTKIGMAIVDRHGNVLVSTGWQDICTKFHRVNPDTAKHCYESDLELSSGVGYGEFKLYKCKNNMWDIATPIIINEAHLGNLYLGQFFFDDDNIDYEIFRAQAVKYGFNVEEYMENLAEVPRWTRETVNTAMDFYTMFTMMISGLGHSNINLTKLLSERDNYIASREQAEDDLRETNEYLNFYRLVVDNMEGCKVAVVDTNYCYRIVSSHYLEGNNLTKADFVGKTVAELMGIEVFEGVIKHNLDRALKGQVVNYADWFDMPGKGKRFLEICYYPIRGEDNLISSVAAISRDITEQKKAKDVIEQREAELAAIYENAPLIMMLVDTERKINKINGYGISFAGKPENEMLGRRGGEALGCLHALDDPEGCGKGPHCEYCAVRRTVLETFETAKPCHQVEASLPFLMEGKEERLHFLISTEMINLREQQVVLVCLQDITNQKRADEALRTLNDELEERVRERTAQLEAANRELDAFTHSASHDLRSPLNRISGFSNALLEDCSDQLDLQSRHYLQRINSSCEHMKLLIDDLLKLSRVSQMQLSREPVELSVLVNIYLKELLDREPGRQVEIAITPGLVVEGDTALLRIALENLLSNAWKYTAGQGKARIEFGSTVQDGKEVCYIRDNGTGFDMKHAKKIFTAFQRLHDSKKYPGTGIGLSIVSRIISRHGGEIWAEGEPDKGACFYFTLS